MSLLNLPKSVLDFPNNIPLLFPSVLVTEKIISHYKNYGFKGDNNYLNLTKVQDDEKYIVVISARNDTSVGHIYISWGRESSDFNQSISDGGGFGYYPTAKEGIGRFYDNGILQQESERHPEYKNVATKNLIINIDKEIYNSTLHYKNYWSSNKDDKYFLLGRNCMTFVDDIATRIGLKTPSSFTGLTEYITMPWKYLDQIIKLNKDMASR